MWQQISSFSLPETVVQLVSGACVASYKLQCRQPTLLTVTIAMPMQLHGVVNDICSTKQGANLHDTASYPWLILKYHV